jgi:nicotinamidase-related amidase
MSRTALFVIDIQHDLALDRENRIPHADRVLSAAEKVIASTRRQLDAGRAETPESPSRPLLVFVQHSEDPSSGSLVKGSKPWELVFQPREGDGDEILVGKVTSEFNCAACVESGWGAGGEWIGLG